MERQVCGQKYTKFHKPLKIQEYTAIDGGHAQRSVKDQVCRFFRMGGVLSCGESFLYSWLVRLSVRLARGEACQYTSPR